MNEEARNAIFQSLGEWGVHMTANAQHKKFYNKCTQQVDRCLSGTPIPRRNQVDQHELPNDMHGAVRHVYREAILVYKNTDNLDEMEEDELVHLVSIDDNLGSRCSTVEQQMEVLNMPPYFFHSHQENLCEKNERLKSSRTVNLTLSRDLPRQTNL